MAKIRLITRGDDFGSFIGANRAILDAFKNGILRNASIMAVGAYVEEAAKIARNEPDLCVGLHLSFSSEWATPRWKPVSDPTRVQSLINKDGDFFPSACHLHEHGFRMEEMKLEAQAQLDHVRALGVNIRYVDEHMGIGWVFEKSKKQRFEDWVGEWVGREGLIWHKEKQKRLPKLYNDPENNKTVSLIQKLECISEPGNYLVMTHPALPSPDTSELQHWDFHEALGEPIQRRILDYAMLIDPTIKTYLEEHNIETVTYAEC